MTALAPGPVIGELWRYPDLAVRLRWSETVTGRELAGLVARGIADRHTPESALRQLVEDGEFAVAAAMLDDIAGAGLVDRQAAERLARLIRSERTSAAERITVQASLLRERAQRAGAAAVDVSAVVADACDRQADAQAHLDELDIRVAKAEQDRTDEIGRELEAVLDESGPDMPPSAATLAWADEIRALLRVKEFLAARQMLTAGPESAPLLPVEEPTASWPWKTAALNLILGWFGGNSPLAPPGLRDYVLDDPGERLLRAMRQLDGTRDAAYAALAGALLELIGAGGITPHLEPLPGGGHLVMLPIPDEFRLPRLSFVGRGGGLRMVIGRKPPETTGEGWAAWLATRISEPRRPGSVLLDLGGLLSLLQTEKPRSGRPRSVSSRRMGLIRMVCEQLPVHQVIGPDAFAATPRAELRSQLWWLLHALGMSPDGAAADTLMYESGAHPRILVLALRHIVEYVRRERLARLEPDAFDNLRASSLYLGAVQEEVQAELGDAAAAALFTVIFFSSAADLRSALDTIAADAELLEPVSRLIDLAEVTARLQDAGYLIADGSGASALCECGVIQLLRNGDPHEMAKQALRRLAETRPTVRLTADQAELQEVQFLRRLAEIRLHAEMRRADMAEEKSHAADIRRDRHLREDRQQVESWRSEHVPIDLVEACRKEASQIEALADNVDINVYASDPVTVLGSRMALRIALNNVICNAEQAVEENRAAGDRDVFVTVSVRPGAQSRAVVDIEDNGPGIPPEVAERVAQGAPPPSTRHDGSGEGIVGAVLLLQLLGGSLEIMPEPSATLGGAHVRLSILLPPAT